MSFRKEGVIASSTPTSGPYAHLWTPRRDIRASASLATIFFSREKAWTYVVVSRQLFKYSNDTVVFTYSKQDVYKANKQTINHGLSIKEYLPTQNYFIRSECIVKIHQTSK